MDPLRPFADLIRSLWSAGKSRPAQRAAGRTETAAAARSEPKAVSSSARVAGRLQPRLAALQEWNGERARELFVEQILLVELGEDLARDPAFVDLVQRVSVQLGSEPAVRARLDELLQAMAAGKHVT